VIRIIRQTERDALDDLLKRLEARSVAFDPELMNVVSSIVADVRARGDEALIDYTARFDGVQLKELRVDQQTLNRSADKVDRRVLDALREAIRNVRAFHEQQIELSWEISADEGVRLGQRITPLESVGLYVQASSVLW
jgi:histidinol dehydrogenase